MALRTSNPALRESTFTGFRTTVSGGDTMTLQGTVDKTFLLLMALVVSAASVWGLFLQGSPLVMPLMLGGMLGAFILSLIVIFKPTTAPILGPLYALCEGAVLGGLSALFEVRYPGVPMQAVGCTFGTLFCLLAAYRSGVIKATENFKLGVVAATGGICLYYMVNLFSSLIFHVNMPGIATSGPVGILLSLAVVVVAALNLVLDFDFIETGVSAGAPRYMEWYAAFGLMLTLIWLYLEFLRLLAKLRDRN